MLFITLSPKELSTYAYLSTRLNEMLYNLSNARKNLEGVANASFDRPLAKCIYLFASESLQCEREINSQIESLGCNHDIDNSENTNKMLPLGKALNDDSICNYCERAYIERYKELLKDKQLTTSLKTLFRNHLQLFVSSLTQLRLFSSLRSIAY